MKSLNEVGFTRSVLTVQWGQNGCFLTLRYDRSVSGPIDLGSRVDVPYDLSITMEKSGVANIKISGTWYVYEISSTTIANTAIVTLIRQPNLHHFGDGTTSTIKKIAELYPDFEAFLEADRDYYFTWTNSVRKYKTIVKLATKINLNKFPVFDIDGKLKLYNLENRRIERSLIEVLDTTFPPSRQVPENASYDYLMYSRLGEPFKVEGNFLNPGYIYQLKFRNPILKDEEHQTFDYIARDILLARGSDDETFTPSVYLSMIMKKDLYGEQTFPEVISISSEIGDLEEKHLSRYDSQMKLKE